MNTPTNVCPGFPWAYTLLAYGFSWLIWSPSVLATAAIIPAPLPVELFTGLLLMLGAFGPLLAAFTLTAREEGRAGVRRLLARGRQWRIGLLALAMILGLPFVASATARALDMLTGGTPPLFALEAPLALLPTFMFILLLGGPIQEEFAWRGYMLPPASVLGRLWRQPDPGHRLGAVAPALLVHGGRGGIVNLSRFRAIVLHEVGNNVIGCTTSTVVSGPKVSFQTRKQGKSGEHVCADPLS